MAAAWPYCDAVVSAHRLAALDDLLAAWPTRAPHRPRPRVADPVVAAHRTDQSDTGGDERHA